MLGDRTKCWGRLRVTGVQEVNRLYAREAAPVVDSGCLY